MLGILENVSLEALATTVARNRVSLEERCCRILTPKKAARLAKSTGFYHFSSVDKGVCASDLAVHSAKVLFRNGKTAREEIGAVVFVTQHPDYLCPATAFLIQKRLGLPNDIVAFDVNSSCAGFVYGIFIAASLLSKINQKILLCFGDVTSRDIFYDDLTFASILGDGGGAVILSQKAGSKIWYSFASYGEKFESIIDARGGARGYKTTSSEGDLLQEKENFGKMDGTQVMDFTLNEVTENIRELMTFSGITKDDLEMACFHQANKLIVETLGNQLGLSLDKVPFYCEDIGNTDMASIPICLTEMKKRNEYRPSSKVLLSGFGAGLSVGSMIMDLSDMEVMPTEEI